MHSRWLYFIMKLLVDFVYTFRNFVNVYQQKNETLLFTRVIVSPLQDTHVC